MHSEISFGAAFERDNRKQKRKADTQLSGESAGEGSSCGCWVWVDKNEGVEEEDDEGGTT